MIYTSMHNSPHLLSSMSAIKVDKVLSESDECALLGQGDVNGLMTTMQCELVALLSLPPSLRRAHHLHQMSLDLLLLLHCHYQNQHLL
ncbi:hypothetical protein TcWFU_008928 [Taenia crassiceps]|uniref:Uncharacterized protein n=1 Tax=Taenia crassiceps TaxID=6207 RepID=A0ABR4Q866_9CEST